MTMIMVIGRSGEEDAEHILDGPPTHRAGVRRAGARRTDSYYWGAQQHRTLGAPSDRKVPRWFASRLVR